MSQDEVKTVVGVTLAVMGRIAERTRTKADDLMVAILRANQDRLTQAVHSLLTQPQQPPTDEQVALALAAVGIRV
jgi:predicted unusual protein kinase regulating ubiquinone biosynthesis (AarF/ABC1/UbiB family)